VAWNESEQFSFIMRLPVLVLSVFLVICQCNSQWSCGLQNYGAGSCNFWQSWNFF